MKTTKKTFILIPENGIKSHKEKERTTYFFKKHNIKKK